MKVIIHGKKVILLTPYSAETKDMSLTMDFMETDGGIHSEVLTDLIKGSRFDSITGIEVKE